MFLVTAQCIIDFLVFIICITVSSVFTYPNNLGVCLFLSIILLANSSISIANCFIPSKHKVIASKYSTAITLCFGGVSQFITIINSIWSLSEGNNIILESAALVLVNAILIANTLKCFKEEK